MHLTVFPAILSTSLAYRGRFAPTPSGPLHLGSLVTALASWLAARQVGGEWRLRIDDLDRPRCVPGAVDAILRQLTAHGLTWDGAPEFQTEHEEQYRAVLRQLQSMDDTYACRCTRATLAQSARDGPDGPIYPGTCREQGLALDGAALRFRASPQLLEWQDGIRGRVRRSIPGEAGDFVLQRADGQIGYQLACVVDEHLMGITNVVRGDDLLGSTVHQLLLMDRLGQSRPTYAHVPVLHGTDGRKLSKQNGAPALAIDSASVRRQLRDALRALGLALPPELQLAGREELLQWARSNWNLRREVVAAFG